MIRKLISRVFGGKKAAASHHEPAVIPVSSHGITRDRISSGSRRVCETLQENGHMAYVVGGAVRDLLIGAEPKDFDIATDATPEEVRRYFRRARIIGRRLAGRARRRRRHRPCGRGSAAFRRRAGYRC